MSNPSLPEVWLRGPVEGVPAVLMPAAHAFLQVGEEVAAVAASLSSDELWVKPGGAASAGFHLQHIVGATDRLLTYARGEALSDAQKAYLKSEGTPGQPAATAESLAAAVQKSIADAVDVLRRTPAESVTQITEARAVGRAALPTTVLGLLFHAAEHAQRHAGQLTTTVKILRGSGTESQ
jgi:uncharacterized damage-inducible protein DinB